MKKILIFLTVLLAACSGGADNKDTLIFAHKGEMQSLDPVYPYDGVSQGLIMNVYDTFIKFKGSSVSEFEPLVSELPEISKDGLIYKFKIKKGIKFHDGRELTAEDARYSLLRFMLTDRAGGPSNLLLEPILGISSTRTDNGFVPEAEEAFERVKTEGDYVVIKLKKPFAPFVSIMARWSYVMSKTWCAENGQWNGEKDTWKNFNNPDKNSSYLFDHMNGTGPFKLARWDIPGKKLTLSSNEEYFLGAAKLKNIYLITVEDASTLRLMLESGDVDFAEISKKAASSLKGNNSVVLKDNLPRLMTDPVLFFTQNINTAANPDTGSGRLDGEGIPADFFTDKNLRKAFAYAFDYNAFLKDTMEGKGTLAKGPVPPGLVGYSEDAPYYNFDMEKAKEYFKKAWGGQVWEKGFRFTMSYNSSGDMRQIACEILKRNVESINPKFKIDLRSVTWASFLEKTDARKMPLWARGWVGDYADAHNFVFPFLHSQGRYAYAQGFANKQFDALIEKAVTETDVKKRAELYKQIQNLSYEEAMQIYTVHPTGLWAHTKEVKGFYDNPVFMGVYFYPLYKI